MANQVAVFGLSGRRAKSKDEPDCGKAGEKEVGEGTDYPVEMDVEDVAFLYWKADTIKIRVTGCLVATREENSSSNCGNGKQINGVWAGISMEQTATLWVCEGGSLGRGYEMSGIHKNGAGGSDEFNFELVFGMAFGEEKYKENPDVFKNKKCWPKLGVGMDLSSYDAGGISSIKGVKKFGQTTIKIKDKTYTFPLWLGTEGNPENQVSGSINVDIEVIGDRKK